MKKTLKIFLLIILFSILLITTVNAAGILMNLQDYTQENQNYIEENTDIETQLNNDLLNDTQSDENDEAEEETNYRVTASSTVSNDEEFLTTENVLAIIIIVIGILLVLLSIAILIRLK